MPCLSSSRSVVKGRREKASIANHLSVTAMDWVRQCWTAAGGERGSRKIFLRNYAGAGISCSM